MEYLFLNNEIVLKKIKEKIVYDKIPEFCEKLQSYIDYSKVYFFVDLNPDNLGFIYTMISAKHKIDKLNSFQVCVGIKINMINSIFHLLDFLTNSNNDNKISFVVHKSYTRLGLYNTFLFNPGDIYNKISKKVKIHDNDRIYSSYFDKYEYDDMCFTIDSYQNEQLFRKTFKMLFQNGELFLFDSYPSFFQYTWNCLKNVLTQKKVKNDKKGNPHIKLHDE